MSVKKKATNRETIVILRRVGVGELHFDEAIVLKRGESLALATPPFAHHINDSSVCNRKLDLVRIQRLTLEKGAREKR